ncbi:MAG: DNA mismatch repair protein MutS, partial [Clostridiales bacterium]|nr:DNA mismatch repair protein MutS [Clostridiales bacterium]
MGKLSPMMQQYFEMKKDYPDTLLFFRLGDFYEMFFDDARTASRELDLVLTGRDCGLEERAPMCGVPFHSADSYIAKLVAKGYKIAICEQMEDPAAAKGLVRRDVVRVITPGTVIEGNMLDEGRNNYLCAISMNAEGAGLCFADASTGEIHITVLGTADLEEKLLNELSTYSPREILVNQHLWQMERVRKFALDRLGATFELL